MRAGVASVGLWVFGSLFSQTLPTEPLPTPLTPWLSGNPTIPTYKHCLNHPTVIPWSYTFQTGCYDVVTGEALDCQETWILYWSTEGVAAQEVDHVRGAHLHPRQSGEHPLASIGEIQLDVVAQRSARSGEWRTGGRSHDATVFYPEAAGVSRFFIYFVAPPGYYAVTNDVWVWDPSDRTHRAGMATFNIFAPGSCTDSQGEPKAIHADLKWPGRSNLQACRGGQNEKAGESGPRIPGCGA